MAIREDVVASAVTFLQDPSVHASPLENRIAFLHNKNLTQEEIDVALTRAGGESVPNYSNFSPQQTARQSQPVYGGYQQHQWQQSPPPEIPKRDWRDWFIMATVMGGVSYGLYTVAKRYVVPMIAPPTTPQLEQDKQAIDESFEKAFALLEQLSKDTDVLKASEQARTERLDAALTDVEKVIGELKASSQDRDRESRRVHDEVRGLKDLIPKAIEGVKETTDLRLKDLNNELKSLKILMGQRIGTPVSTGNSPYSGPGTSRTSANVTGSASSSGNDAALPKTASAGGSNTEPASSLQGRSASPFSTGALGSKPSIPSWQMAAASKSNASTSEAGKGSDFDGVNT